jgi:hypothetical protein
MSLPIAFDYADQIRAATNIVFSTDGELAFLFSIPVITTLMTMAGLSMYENGLCFIKWWIKTKSISDKKK